MVLRSNILRVLRSAIGVVRLTEFFDVTVEGGLGKEGIELVIEDVAGREG
jgi:hypothetical protein